MKVYDEMVTQLGRRERQETERTYVEPTHGNSNVIEDGSSDTANDGVEDDAGMADAEDLLFGSTGIDVGLIDVVG